MVHQVLSPKRRTCFSKEKEIIHESTIFLEKQYAYAKIVFLVTENEG